MTTTTPSITQAEVTREDIKKFFLQLKEHLSLLDALSKASEEAVFCAEFIQEGCFITVTVTAYNKEEASISEVVRGLHVKFYTEWTMSKRLWFRLRNGEPEAFIEYLDDYVDKFKVQLELPQVTFVVNLR